jgi:hypothetical protein
MFRSRIHEHLQWLKMDFDTQFSRFFLRESKVNGREEKEWTGGEENWCLFYVLKLKFKQKKVKRSKNFI